MKKTFCLLIVALGVYAQGPKFPVSVGGGGSAGQAPYSQNFSGQANSSNLTLTHALNTVNAEVECRTAAGATIEVLVPDASRTATSLDVSFPGSGGPFTGTCRVVGGGPGPTGSAGPTGPPGAGVDDPELDALANLASGSNTCFYFSAPGTAAEFACTEYMRTLMNSADNNAVLSAISAANVSHAHSGADITSGTLPGARLPNPSASVKGGVVSLTCDPGMWISGIGTDGAPDCTTVPAGGEVTSDSGTYADGQMVVSSGTSGNAIKPLAGDGIPLLSGGVPTLLGTNGTGNVLRGTNPTLTGPTIGPAQWGAANHDHTAGSSGGTLTSAALTGKQGNSATLQMAGTISGTGAPMCADANGNTTTSGCQVTSSHLVDGTVARADVADGAISGLKQALIMNNVTSLPYTVLEASRGNVVSFNSASSGAVTLPAFPNDWYVTLSNRHNTSVVTVTPSSGTIGGASSVDLNPGDSMTITQLGGHYFRGSPDMTKLLANVVTAAGTMTSNAPVIGAGSKAVAVGTASGNTTQFATVTGTKTAGRQLAFDTDGNVVASAYNVGAAGGGGGAAGNPFTCVITESPDRLTCTADANVVLRRGAYVYTVTAGTTFTYTNPTGTGTAIVYFGCAAGTVCDPGAFTFQSSDISAVTGSAGTGTVFTGGTILPPGAIPIVAAQASANNFVPGTVADIWAGAAAEPIMVSGDNIDITCEGDHCTFDGAAGGEGGGGANADGRYLVTRAADAPTNAVNLGALTTGLLKISVASSIATPSTAVPGTDYMAADATLTALAAHNTDGILTQTAADTFTGRTITGTANEIVVTNGNGVSGNPTLALGNALLLNSKNVRMPGSSSLPTGTDCDASGEVGRVFYQSGDPASVPSVRWVCEQTGASSYGWRLDGPQTLWCGTTAWTNATGTETTAATIILPPMGNGLLQIRTSWTHANGTSGTWRYRMALNGTGLFSEKSVGATETFVSADVFARVLSTSSVRVYGSTQAGSNGAITTIQTPAAVSPTVNDTATNTLTLLGRMTAPTGTETIGLEHGCVTFYPNR